MKNILFLSIFLFLVSCQTISQGIPQMPLQKRGQMGGNSSQLDSLITKHLGVSLQEEQCFKVNSLLEEADRQHWSFEKASLSKRFQVVYCMLWWKEDDRALFSYLESIHSQNLVKEFDTAPYMVRLSLRTGRFSEAKRFEKEIHDSYVLKLSSFKKEGEELAKADSWNVLYKDFSLDRNENKEFSSFFSQSLKSYYSERIFWQWLKVIHGIEKYDYSKHQELKSKFFFLSKKDLDPIKVEWEKLHAKCWDFASCRRESQMNSYIFYQEAQKLIKKNLYAESYQQLKKIPHEDENPQVIQLKEDCLRLWRSKGESRIRDLYYAAMRQNQKVKKKDMLLKAVYTIDEMLLEFSHVADLSKNLKKTKNQIENEIKLIN